MPQVIISLQRTDAAGANRLVQVPLLLVLLTVVALLLVHQLLGCHAGVPVAFNPGAGAPCIGVPGAGTPEVLNLNTRCSCPWC